MIFLVVLVFIAIAIAGVRLSRTISPEARAEVGRVVRNARLAAGADSLDLIMRHMLDRMRESRVRGVRRFYVPNCMAFGVHPDDYSRWGQYADRIAEELIELLVAEVKANNWTLAGDGTLRVRISRDEQGRPGRPTFAAGIRGDAVDPSPRVRADPGPRRAEPASSGPHTVPATVQDPAQTRTVDVPTSWRLDMAGRPGAAIGSELLIGRARTCGLRLPDARVSGQHARLALMDGVVTLIDLASTNGTFVNGQQVDSARLELGDEIRFGPDVSAVLRA